MRKVILPLVLVFLMPGAALFAKGKKDDDSRKTQNDEWILCVTEFDASTLSKEKNSIANVITRTLVESIKAINHRYRVSSEYAYYEENAWYRQRLGAAKALAAKQEERALLIYRGDAKWKYRQDLARLDTDIEKLVTALETADNEAPLINTEPIFKLTSGNMNMSFPQPPTEGGEVKFCQGQKADAFLTGSVMEFHGRFYVTVKLYTLFTKSFAYEDSIIFSPEDLDSAMDEIAKRLLLTLSGSRPAAIAVRAEPEHTLVLINRSFAGRGETETLEFPPGKVTVTASAPDHESIVIETELLAGELTEIDITLKPYTFADVLVSGLYTTGSIYHGALYAGEAPLMLRLPLDLLESVELDVGPAMKGTGAFRTPLQENALLNIAIPASVPQPPGKVESARRTYYWAWGGTWITGIAAWITYHSFLNYQQASHYATDYNPQFEEDYNRMYYISTAAIIAVSAAVMYEIFHIGRYVYIANQASMPIIKPDKNKRETRAARKARESHERFKAAETQKAQETDE